MQTQVVTLARDLKSAHPKSKHSIVYDLFWLHGPGLYSNNPNKLSRGRVTYVLGRWDYIYTPAERVWTTRTRINTSKKVQIGNMRKSTDWRSRKLTLKPPIRWSLLNSFPFLYHFSLGVGLPLAWQRNLTVLLAGTAWSFFSIFSGWAHCGAIARKFRNSVNQDTRYNKTKSHNNHWLSISCWEICSQFFKWCS